MKNLIIPTILLLLLSFTCNAQIKLGVKGGLNASKRYFDFEGAGEPETIMKLGFQLGVIADINLSEKFTVLTGLSFTQKGDALDIEETYSPYISAEGYSRVNFNYLELPINAALNLGIFQITAGPFIALGLGGKLKSDATIIDEDGNTFTLDNELKLVPSSNKRDAQDYERGKDYFNRFDYGLNIGTSVGNDQFRIALEYQIGLGNQNVKKEGVTNDTFLTRDNISKHRVLSLTGIFYIRK